MKIILYNPQKMAWRQTKTFGQRQHYVIIQIQHIIIALQKLHRYSSHLSFKLNRIFLFVKNIEISN